MNYSIFEALAKISIAITFITGAILILSAIAKGFIEIYENLCKNKVNEKKFYFFAEDKKTPQSPESEISILSL